VAGVVQHLPVCDQRYATNDLIANWLSEREDNRLPIMSGERTEDKWFGHYGPATFDGIRNHYLRGLQGRPEIAGHVLICDYNNMAHEDVLSEFAGVVRTPPDVCPIAASGPSPGVVAP
jgi:hypothetical protein